MKSSSDKHKRKYQEFQKSNTSMVQQLSEASTSEIDSHWRQAISQNSLAKKEYEREPLQRRLDSLARLLEGEEPCVAVCAVDGGYDFEIMFRDPNQDEQNALERGGKLLIIKKNDEVYLGFHHRENGYQEQHIVDQELRNALLNIQREDKVNLDSNTEEKIVQLAMSNANKFNFSPKRRIIVTSNSLKDYQKGGNQFTSNSSTSMIEMLQHFQSCVVDNSPNGSKAERTQARLTYLTEKICKTRINAINSGCHGKPELQIQIDDHDLYRIISFLYRQDDQRNYRFKQEEAINVTLSEEDKALLKRGQEAQTLNELKPEEQQKLNDIYNKRMQTLKIYPLIWRLVRDYKKTKQFIKQNPIDSFCLLRAGDADEHAEIRLIGYLLETRRLSANKPPVYIGISKLCCTDCVSVVNIINHYMQHSLSLSCEKEDALAMVENTTPVIVGTDTPLPSHHKKEAAEGSQLGIEEIKHEIIKIRGRHGLSFSTNWGIPKYLLGEAYLSSDSRIANVNEISEPMKISVLDQAVLSTQVPHTFKICRTFQQGTELNIDVDNNLIIFERFEEKQERKAKKRKKTSQTETADETVIKATWFIHFRGTDKKHLTLQVNNMEHIEILNHIYSQNSSISEITEVEKNEYNFLSNITHSLLWRELAAMFWMVKGDLQQLQVTTKKSSGSAVLMQSTESASPASTSSHTPSPVYSSQGDANIAQLNQVVMGNLDDIVGWGTSELEEEIRNESELPFPKKEEEMKDPANKEAESDEDHHTEHSNYIELKSSL